MSRLTGRVRGVRARVTAVATVAVLAILLAAAAGIWLSTRAQLLTALDRDLLRRAADVEALESPEPVARAMPLGSPAWQLVGPDGEVLVATEGLPEDRSVVPPRTVGGGIVTTTVDAGEEYDDPVRLVARSVTLRDGSRGVVVVLAEVEEVEDALASLLAALAVAVPVATLLLGGLVWVLVGRALAPVDAIRREVADIQGTDLDRRVPVPAGDDEVARLAVTMNAMLDRLEASAATQRRFVADASHELRSPLTRLRAQLETAATGDDVGELRERLLADTDEVQHLVEDLLLLARIDEDRLPAPVRTDLDEVVLEEVARARPAADRAGVVLDAGRVTGAEVLGDRGALARVVRNLLDNAVRHAAGRVEVGLRTEGDVVRLVVADDGPGVPEEHAARVFERFTRLDEARNRDAGGSGLGLAIVREVAQRHGGEVLLGRSDDGGARLTVELPRPT